MHKWMSACVLIKLYLQKKSVGWIWLVSYSFLSTDIRGKTSQEVFKTEWIVHCLGWSTYINSFIWCHCLTLENSACSEILPSSYRTHCCLDTQNLILSVVIQTLFKYVEKCFFTCLPLSPVNKRWHPMDGGTQPQSVGTSEPCKCLGRENTN